MQSETLMKLTDELDSYATVRRDELDALLKNGSKQPEHVADYAARQREIEAIATTLHILGAAVTCIGNMYNHPRAEATQRAIARLDVHRVKMALREFTDAQLRKGS